MQPDFYFCDHPPKLNPLNLNTKSTGFRKAAAFILEFCESAKWSDKIYSVELYEKYNQWAKTESSSITTAKYCRFPGVPISEEFVPIPDTQFGKILRSIFAVIKKRDSNSPRNFYYSGIKFK